MTISPLGGDLSLRAEQLSPYPEHRSIVDPLVSERMSKLGQALSPWCPFEPGARESAGEGAGLHRQGTRLRERKWGPWLKHPPVLSIPVQLP